MKVPFNDLNKHHLSIKKELDNTISQVISESSFIRGPHVLEFEKRFASMFNAKNCISCANGTDALYIAIKSLGIKPGDEVIVPAHSWISTSEIVTQAGGKVVFCDTNSEDYTIDIHKITEKITDKTVGIIPVHLYGQPADIEKIIEISKAFNLWVIEDCAQAHLATYNKKLVGTFGDVATFSFYPGKNLGAMGDAGAIICDDKNIADRMAKFARHGGLTKGVHDIEGINSRLDGMQAAILNVKLNHIKEWTKKRQKAAKKYINHLSSVKALTLPNIGLHKSHVWHLFVIQHPERDKLSKYLNDNNVQTSINYPIALPFLKAYERYNHKHSDFPNAYFNQSRILSLPIYPEIEDEQIEYVCKLICDYC